MAADQKKADSVYDFLYVDLHRIGLLLSQFGGDGVLKELVRESASGSASGGGFDVKLLKGEAKENESRTLTRRFDPQWLIPLRFLDLVQDRLSKDITSAALGSLVLVEGHLWVSDTTGLQTLYGEGSPLRSIAMNKALERANAAGEEFSYETAELELDMVTSMPSQVHFHLFTKTYSVWSTLRPDGLITPASEIAVKHGLIVDGDWYIVGIKDANAAEEDVDVEWRTNAINTAYAQKLHMIDVAFVSEGRRRLFGRPYNSYGVTPLMIFRPIGSE